MAASHIRLFRHARVNPSPPREASDHFYGSLVGVGATRFPPYVMSGRPSLAQDSSPPEANRAPTFNHNHTSVVWPQMPPPWRLDLTPTLPLLSPSWLPSLLRRANLSASDTHCRLCHFAASTTAPPMSYVTLGNSPRAKYSFPFPLRRNLEVYLFQHLKGYINFQEIKINLLI